VAVLATGWYRYDEGFLGGSGLFLPIFVGYLVIGVAIAVTRVRYL
jgi:hypothetical protein